MRDAAGDSGEFYTPRPVIRFIVQQVHPKLGEIVLDPACGTGGFLVETLEHLAPNVQTTDQRRMLHDNLRGIEKKPLPYLLGMMNLVLHGVGQPNIIRGNALSKPITQISKSERVDVVLTNPPFGAEEERTVQSNFPADKQTGETAWLFLQLVIRQLKDGGRCGIVVPNSVLFGEGVGTRIRQQLLTDCNLHTVVRLPPGVFEPYTDIPSNLLFFEKSGRTKDVWFYELRTPEGRKKYSKTKPLLFDEFAECQKWWQQREPNDRAWRVSIAEIEAADFSLDLRNPNGSDDLTRRSPLALVDEAIEAEAAAMQSLQVLRGQLVEMVDSVATSTMPSAGWERVMLRDLLEPTNELVEVDPTETYRIAGVYSFGRGVIDRGTIMGSETSYKKLRRLTKGEVVFSKLGAWEGAIAVVDSAFDGYYVSSEFPTFRFTSDRMDPDFFRGVTRSPKFWDAINSNTRGSMARRKRISPDQFLETRVWLPDHEWQLRAARHLSLIDSLDGPVEVVRSRSEVLTSAIFNPVFNDRD
jgi:type I restriction enzyme M protein